MQKNHAKAIKGMSIACIALSGVIILCCFVGIAVMSALGPIIQEALADQYYDYGYGGYGSIYGQLGIGGALADVHHGYGLGGASYYDYYDDYAAYQLAASIVNIMLGLMIVAEAVVLVAGILVLRNYNKPEKFGMVFGWSIAGAVLGFICAGIVQAVLFIIIAVFVNSDKKLYRAGLYYVDGAAPAAAYYAAQPPVQPVPPTAAPAQPAQQAMAPQPAVAAQPVQQAAVQQPQANPTSTAVAAAVSDATQPPAPQASEAMQPAEPVALEAAAVEVAAVEPAPQPAQDAPVVVDEGAVISIEPGADQPEDK